jgi:hypothetical protein
MKRRLQFAYRIDTSVVTPLSLLPQAVASDPPPSLAQRNLLRGFELGLPTGQSVAKAMGVKPLTDVRLSSARRSTSRAPTMSLGLSPSCRNSPPSGVSARYGPTSSPKPQGRRRRSASPSPRRLQSPPHSSALSVGASSPRSSSACSSAITTRSSAPIQNGSQPSERQRISSPFAIWLPMHWASEPPPLECGS